jgi:hypothetical protein
MFRTHTELKQGIESYLQTYEIAAMQGACACPQTVNFSRFDV